MERSESSARAARFVLEGVPRVHFYEGGKRCPEDSPFPSSLRACLEYMGDSYGCDHISTPSPVCELSCTYAYIMCTCGYAFWLGWKSGWHPDNNDIFSMFADKAEPFRLAFEAVGYAHELILKQDAHDDEYFRNRIVESIGRRHPVLAFGVIGPPECCIITGYDAKGDILVGWNFFQNIPEISGPVEKEPSGYFRVQHWFPSTSSLIIIGEKQERLPMTEIFRKILKTGVHVARTPEVDGRQGGLAAYVAWADQLLRDEDFSTDDLASLRERHMIHDDAVGMVAEARWYASVFLPQIARHEPAMAEKLLAAASCYAAEHDLMWKVWRLVGGIGRDEAKAKKFAETAIRRMIAEVILQARDRDAEAVELIEEALSS